MNPLLRRVFITLVILAIPPLLGLLFTSDIIKIQWVGTMQIQPAYRPMDDPLPVPVNSVPIQGAAFVPLTGSPTNPNPTNPASIARGKELYAINCLPCHGEKGDGKGPVAAKLLRKPANLTGPNVTQLSDGEIFMIITNGVPIVPGFTGGMPDMRSNLFVPDRWDVVNYVRTLGK